ncbi:hypothetical protein GALMADRAFT_932901 [Galerina marginata CBS 339.88]|uniref:Uncharacterized protein n=1 Tax=Galerina marginata (strain CBS 339.88) TaxID=685588 RepID=A0A067SDR5_GALM3|nr:hypothetical protein GALMADRAFT_932901 [Galerina marginata CBS 339.88]
MLTLETLKIKDVSIVDLGAEDSKWPTIVFPKINLLSLSVDLITLILLLGHIAPTNGCDLEIESLDNTLDILSDQDTALLRQGFIAHFHSFSEHGHNETLSFEITEYFFSLKNNLNQEGYDCELSHFQFRISISSDSPWHGIPNIIIDSLHSLTDISSITSLEITAADEGPIASNPSFSLLLHALS